MFALNVALLLVALDAQPDHATLRQHAFTVAKPTELVASLIVRCDTCDWSVEGREAVVLTVHLDNRTPLSLPITRSGRAEYRMMLGAAAAGKHMLHIAENPGDTARDLRQRGAAVVENMSIAEVGFGPLALAPMVYARPNTVGRFTDVPLFMWYEVEPTSRGQRFRYSVIFSNEDGGTPADRLMATWGRTTDIEYIYSVEVDARGAIVADDMQGPKHEILPFRGTRDGTHPLLWVSTDNNMVLDTGSTRVKYAPAPIAFPLDNVSREALMDANPWLYEVMTKELAREGKIVDDAGPGAGVIPDPRRFAYIEGCGEMGDSALTFELRVGDAWISSDRGVAEYRIVRDGCFRAAVPLSATAKAADIHAVRVAAHTREGKPTATPVRFTRLNTVFMLDEQYRPGRALVSWQGNAELKPGGQPLEINVR
jgi:hypothetical protein